MTRINVVPPQELCGPHLVAEFRELTRIPSAIQRGKYSMRGQPPHFVLGEGHVKFFYDKLLFLHKRYWLLYRECKLRGIKVTFKWPVLTHIDPNMFNDYTPTEEALKLSRARIKQNMPKNPWYIVKAKHHANVQNPHVHKGIRRLRVS